MPIRKKERSARAGVSIRSEQAEDQPGQGVSIRSGRQQASRAGCADQIRGTVTSRGRAVSIRSEQKTATRQRIGKDKG